MLAAVRSATLVGVDGQPVTVEVHVSSGLPAYHVVGLPDTAVRESRERVPRRAAVVAARVPDAAHHRQPRAGRCAQVGLRPRARGRARAPGRGRRAPRRRARCRRRARRARPRRHGARGAGHARARRRARAPRYPIDHRAVGERRRSRAGARRARARRRATSSSSARVSRARRNGRRGTTATSPPTITTPRPTTNPSTSARCAGSPSPGARSRSRRREPTTCSSSGHREPARRCWRDASSPCSRRSSTTKRSRSPGSTPPPARRSAGACSPADRSGPLTTPRRPLPSWEAAAADCGPAKSRSPTGGCSFSTSSVSSRPPRSTRSANPWRNASCASRANTPRSRSRRRSSSSRARTRARVVSVSRTAGAASRNGCDTGAG